MKTEDENAAKEVKFIQIIVNEFSFNQNVSNSKIIKIHTENLFYLALGVSICLDMVSIETLDLDVVKE